MIIRLREVAQLIASDRGVTWHSGLDRQLFDLEKRLQNGEIDKKDAVKKAAKILKIEKSYDPDYKKLEDSIK